MNEFKLENLSLREKILLCLATFLLAIFLSFHFYQYYLKDFFTLEFFSLDENINEKIAFNQNLKAQIKKLKQELNQSREKSLSYENYLSFFDKNSQEYIAKLYDLALENKLKIQKLTQNPPNQVLLELEGDFYPLLYFIAEVENSNLAYQIHSLEMNNAKNLHLYLKLKISFITLENIDKS